MMKNINNLTINSRHSNVAEFYNSASILLNLSDKERFIETFGLTVLEGMSAGLPAIVPTAGGIAEMVNDGVNGYKIDVKNLEHIARQIKTILSDKELYTNLSVNALKTSQSGNAEIMVDKIISCME